MARLVVPIAARLVVLAALAAPASAARLVAMGDSITEGIVENAPPDGGVCWVARLQELRPELDVRNAGCGGASSADWTNPPIDGVPCSLGGAYELKAGPQMPATVVTVLLGTNDAIGYFEDAPIERGRYRENLAALLERALADARWAVVMTPPIFPGADEAVRARMTAYRDAILDLCEPAGDAILCGPDLQMLLTGPESGMPGLHPDQQGHDLIAAEMDAFLTAHPALVPEPRPGVLAATALLGVALAGWLRPPVARVR